MGLQVLNLCTRNVVRYCLLFTYDKEYEAINWTNKRAVEPLIKILGDDRWDVRKAANDAVIRMLDDEGIGGLKVVKDSGVFPYPADVQLPDELRLNKLARSWMSWRIHLISHGHQAPGDLSGSS